MRFHRAREIDHLGVQTNTSRHITLSAALLVAAGFLLTVCGGNGTATATASAGCKTVTANVAGSTTGVSGSWPYANVDLANTRDATGSTISSANVARLAPAWTFKLTGMAAAGVRPYGSLTANPIVENGVVYLQDLDSNVYALALTTGKLCWYYQGVPDDFKDYDVQASPISARVGGSSAAAS